MATFSTPRGMHDILPDDWPYWNHVLKQAARVAALFGYQRIETPTLGPTALFARAVGEATDIVEKEMYSLQRGGEDLTLRPEGTAPVVRAYLEHGMSRLPQPVKLYYFENMFRAERPQRGRYREHHQFGCEALGVDDAYVDVEMIALLVELYGRLGLTDLSLHVNSIGDRNCRPTYVAELRDYLHARRNALAQPDRDRLDRSPLRVLDSKEAATRAVLGDAPTTLDFLCAECRAHWEKLRHGLDVLGIAYVEDPMLVRGLDYYNRTVFEFISNAHGAQSAVNGGGRYDPLSELIGGPPVPGIGFGLGIERLILELQDRGIDAPPVLPPAVYVAHVGPDAEDAALCEAQRLRRADIPAVMAFGQRRLKAQIGQAGSLGVPLVAILGEDEIHEHAVTLRRMATGEQETLPADALSHVVRVRGGDGENPLEKEESGRLPMDEKD